MKRVWLVAEYTANSCSSKYLISYELRSALSKFKLASRGGKRAQKTPNNRSQRGFKRSEVAMNHAR